MNLTFEVLFVSFFIFKGISFSGAFTISERFFGFPSHEASGDGSTRYHDDVSPQWSEWSHWGRCSSSCGSGFQHKIRQCLTDDGSESNNCLGLSWNARGCNITPCSHQGDNEELVLINEHFNDESVHVEEDCVEAGKGAAYRGKVSSTVSGRQCQVWTSSSGPQIHTYTPHHYPNAGLGDHAYCRSPDNDTIPWCITLDPDRTWEYCDVPKCDRTSKSRSGEVIIREITSSMVIHGTTTAKPGHSQWCFDDTNPSAYRGNVNESTDGLACKVWNHVKEPEKFSEERYPDKGLGDHNFCRNPDDDLNGPWCFTKDSKVPWGYCNIPKCNAAPTTTVKPTTPEPPLPPLSEKDCGVPSVTMSATHAFSRIIGGHEVVPGSIPWQVSLRSTYTDSHICGGSIINNKWILTAAHCIRRPNLPKTYYGFVGKHFKQYITEDSQKEIHFIEIIRHPNYDASTLVSDIALLRLNETLAFTDRIKPICLPPPMTNTKKDVDRVTIVSGWGVTRGVRPVFGLQQTTVPTISDEHCSVLLSGIHEGMICAGWLEGGKDACQGDSGGPLSGVDGSGKYELVGVVSWGIGCALPGKPGVYTHVSHFIPWIASYIQDKK